MGLDSGLINRRPRSTGSISRRVVGQVAARPKVGQDLDVPGAGQPAEQVRISCGVGRQWPPQVRPTLRDRSLQRLVSCLGSHVRIGLMRRHHELNRVHTESFPGEAWTRWSHDGPFKQSATSVAPNLPGRKRPHSGRPSLSHQRRGDNVSANVHGYLFPQTEGDEDSPSDDSLSMCEARLPLESSPSWRSPLTESFELASHQDDARRR